MTQYDREREFEEKHSQADLFIVPAKRGIEGKIVIYYSPMAMTTAANAAFWRQVAETMKKDLED